MTTASPWGLMAIVWAKSHDAKKPVIDPTDVSDPEL
jgi:hypothetical protein